MNANESLQHFTGTETFYRFHQGMLLTEGAKALADQFQCYWFLDIVVSYQPQLQRHPFQVWELVRDGASKAVVLATDGNHNVLKSQYIPYTDFKAHSATLWVEGNILLLPSEH
jgi:hypothetical protein